MSKTVKYIIGLLAIGFLVIFVRQVDFNHVISEVIKIKWWMLTILLSTLGAYLFATKAWQISFSTTSDVRPKFEKLFVVRQIGETLTLINPTNIVGGEISKIYMLRSAGFAPGEVGTSIVLSRGLIILSYIFLVIMTLSYFIFQGHNSIDRNLIILIIAAACGLFCFLFYLITSRKLLLHSFFYNFFSFLKLKKCSGFTARVHRLNNVLFLFYKEKRGVMALAFAYSLGHWLLGSLEFYFILTALEMDVSFFDALTIEMGVMAFKSFGGFVPGQIGIEEYANKLMLGVIGIHDAELWIIVSIIRRARQLFWVALSFIFLGVFYKSYKWKSYS